MLAEGSGVEKERERERGVREMEKFGRRRLSEAKPHPLCPPQKTGEMDGMSPGA